MDTEQRLAQQKWTQLLDEGDIWMSFTPETTKKQEYDPLPEGDYTFVVVAPEHWVVEMPDWKLEYQLENWNDLQKVRESEGKSTDYKSTVEELPFDKTHQVVMPLVVCEGEYKGRRLPAAYLGVRFNTDPQYLEKSNWYKLLKAIVPDLKKRADAGNLPDFDTEVVGFRAIAEVEVTPKNKNKCVAYRKHDKHFGKRLDDLELKALALTAGLLKDEARADEGHSDEEIPF